MGKGVGVIALVAAIVGIFTWEGDRIVGSVFSMVALLLAGISGFLKNTVLSATATFVIIINFGLIFNANVSLLSLIGSVFIPQPSLSPPPSPPPPPTPVEIEEIEKLLPPPPQLPPPLLPPALSYSIETFISVGFFLFVASGIIFSIVQNHRGKIARLYGMIGKLREKTKGRYAPSSSDN